jgi:hypothetical protein
LQTLNAGGSLFGMAAAVHPQIIADGANHHVTGVQADADLNRNSVPTMDAFGVLLDRRLHPQRGVTRAYGVILVCDRRAEDRH